MKKDSFLKSLMFPILTVSVLATMAYGSSSETSQDVFSKVRNQLSNNLGQVVSHISNESNESVSTEDHEQLKKEYGDLFLKTLKHLTIEEKYLMKDLMMKAFDRHYEKLTTPPFDSKLKD